MFDAQVVDIVFSFYIDKGKNNYRNGQIFSNFIKRIFFQWILEKEYVSLYAE